MRDGAAVEYFDHHFTGDAPLPGGVVAHIDTSPRVCTGMLVDRHLHGRQRIWAVVAAFGDNLVDAACDLAASLSVTTGALEALKDLGDALTHNSYSDRVEDAIVPPGRARASSSPTPIRCASLRRARVRGHRRRATARHRTRPRHRAGARAARGAGVRAARCGLGAPRARHLRQRGRQRASPRSRMRCVTVREDGDYAVSVRAPRARPHGADALCRKFGGNGRAAAAGIGRLPREELGEFVARLAERYA